MFVKEARGKTERLVREGQRICDTPDNINVKKFEPKLEKRYQNANEGRKDKERKTSDFATRKHKIWQQFNKRMILWY